MLTFFLFSPPPPPEFVDNKFVSNKKICLPQLAEKVFKPTSISIAVQTNFESSKNTFQKNYELGLLYPILACVGFLLPSRVQQASSASSYIFLLSFSLCSV
jgi:hypothetical protein